MTFKNIPIDALQGIGPKKTALYNKMGIHTTEDLLKYYPVTYQDMRFSKKIADVQDEEIALIKGKVILIASDNRTGRKKQVLRLLVDDNTAKVEVVFFNGFYLKKTIEKSREYYFYGKVTVNRGKKQMIHPQMIREDEFKKEILPVYHTVPGISQKEIRKHVRELLKEDIEEFLPKELVEKNNLCPMDFEISNLHFPKDREHLKAAKYRRIYEDLFVMQLGLAMMRREKTNGIAIKGDCDDFEKAFPFQLTKPQKKVVDEILKDMQSSKPMNRLLQGDVGSGKTAVASIAMYNAAICNYQAAFMAPTEILAKQHFDNLKGQFEKFGIKTALLTGSMKAKEKREALELIKSGEVQIVIGTHALIQQDVLFKNLGLVITDEQHRFGVNQRITLGSKGQNPHILVMTATPIPRTLAVILYGDLDISVIDTLPAGRKAIKTVKRDLQDRIRLYEELTEEIKTGSQVYVVAPLIEESEAMEGVKSTSELYEELTKLYKPHNISVGMVHGNMKQEEKDDVMNAFGEGKIDVLVATVVIEVGINVPNATVMVVENAERFGLAQLHQLRGRVGRGNKQSYCYLVSDSKGDIAKKRMEIMCSSTDGFYISEKDLQLRGPGEVFGTRQHGIPDVSIINAVKHIDILEKAKSDAAIYKENFTDSLMKQVEAMYGENITINL